MENGLAQYQNVEVSEVILSIDMCALHTYIRNIDNKQCSMHLPPVAFFSVLCDTNFKLKNGNFHLEFKDDTPDYKMTFSCNNGFEGKFYNEYTCSKGAWSPNPYSAQCYGKHLL